MAGVFAAAAQLDKDSRDGNKDDKKEEQHHDIRQVHNRLDTFLNSAITQELNCP